MNTHRSHLSNLMSVLTLAAVTLLVTVLSLQADSPAYALPANIPALAPQDGGPAVFATVTVGINPWGIGVNPTTNRVYVANMYNNCVSVIDGENNTVFVTVTQTLGPSPYGVGVNPTTNHVYVSNNGNKTVSVIDGENNTVTPTVTVGSYPYGVGVNPATNRVYVANSWDNTVSVIDGANNAVFVTITVGTSPYDVGVNPATNRVYVSNSKDNTVSVIDGASNTAFVTVTVGSSPHGVGVNPTTHRVYVANSNSNTVSVIDGENNTVVTTVPVGSRPYGVGVNPVTNRVYVTNRSDNTVSVIDGETNTVVATVKVGNFPIDVSVNPATSRVYVANYGSNNVSVIQDWVQLFVTNTGSGTGTVASNPAGINCGTDCGEAYAVGTLVTLTATADPDSTFTDWNGGCAGYGDCVLTLNAHTTATATFAPRAASQTVTLTASDAGDYPFGDFCGSIYVTDTTATQMTVTLVYTYPSTSDTGLQRQYDLAADGGVTGTVTLCYEQAELDWAGIINDWLLHIYRYQNATDWQQYSKVDPVANTVTAYNVTELGTFGLGTDTNKPTVVTLRDLTAAANVLPVVIGSLGAVLTAIGALLVRRSRLKGM